MMKKLYILLLMALFTKVSLFSQNINFEDTKFKNALLSHDSIIDINSDREISLAEAKNFKGKLNLDKNKIKSLKGLEHFINITGLYCSHNELTKLDVSKNTALRTLNIEGNKLTKLDVSKNTLLMRLEVNHNQLTNLDVSNNIVLTKLKVYTNKLTSLDVSKNKALTDLRIGENKLTDLDVSENTALNRLDVEYNQLTKLNVSKNKALKRLYAYKNKLKSLNVSENTALIELWIYRNNLTKLDVLKNIALTDLRVGNNELTGLDVSENTALTDLRVNNNKLDSLDVSNNTALTDLRVYDNKLDSLDVSNNTALTDLRVYDNKLDSLDVSNNSELMYLDVDRNKLLEILDLSKCKIRTLWIQDCTSLKTLNLIGQKLNGEIRIERNEKLETVCADLDKVDFIYSKLEAMGNGKYKVSVDCTKKALNRIEGSVKYAKDLNSCGISKPKPKGFNQLKLKIESSDGGGIIRTITPSEGGSYIALVPKGSYELTADLFEDTYYNYSLKPNGSNPSPGLIEFKGEGETKTKNICVTPKRKLDNLAISVSGGKARPGCKVDYRLTYKNIGNTIVSGKVNFKIIDPTKQKFVVVRAYSKVQNEVKTSANITWGFKGLSPFETRSMDVTFKLNKPTDTPAVNGGDKLKYIITITNANGVEKKENIGDNEVELIQEVKNSWDPNDKTCIEGRILRPKNVGKYLTYMIRFENKGSAEATNVRVEDVIDNTKFDIKTLQYISSGRHLCMTEVEGNTVNFNFKDINLGFDPSDNKGYVLFKIKTLKSLKEGDEIKNKASIYFDFNKPVITETETVVVKKKVIKNLKFSDYFTLTPNPTKGPADLIEKKKGLKIRFFTINDSYGDMLAYDPARTRHFDFWYLTTGKVYYLRVFTENNGILSTRFIKE